MRREEKALLLPPGGRHHQSVDEKPLKLNNGSAGRNKYRNQPGGKIFWSPPSTNVPPTPPPRRFLSQPLSQPLSPSMSRTLSPPPPPRGPPSPMPPPSPHYLTIEETQFLTPRRPKKQTQSGFPKRKFRRRSEVNSGTQESRAYMQLREASNGVQQRPPTDRCALVFLSFFFHGLAAALPLTFLLVSETFRTGLVGGCSPWMASPANLMVVLISFQIIGALPASLLPVRCVE